MLTELEHHANLVPWLMLAEERGVELRYLPVGEDYRLDLTRPRPPHRRRGLVGVPRMSNVLGTINDLRPIVEAAHAAGAVVVADGAQLVPHRRVDVTALGVDFLAFTGHKMLGPTGIGVLWGREELLEAMPPFLGGGEMIRDVRLDGFTPNELPWKFEAGTPPIAEAIGLGAAVDYLEIVGHGRASPRTRRPHRVRARALRTSRRRPAVLRAAEPTDGRGGVMSFAFGTSTPTTWPRCSMPRASASGPATTARSPSCAASASGDRASLVLPVQR